ncbi:MAG: hypothetical protein HYX52_09785 [Chloroflexi bacterium]|nr:hypothetical protein [Chloroflexota bacterium]
MEQRAGQRWTPQFGVLLLEDDLLLREMVHELLTEEGFTVTCCDSLNALHAALDAAPNALVISDSWTNTDHQFLSEQQRQEIAALSERASVILTTGRMWAHSLRGDEIGNVTVMPKPYDIDQLLALVEAKAGPHP